MKLKQIKLAGFKSFVDPTKIPFVHDLSAVVGPNGCGKSNVIDAVRWVLGESSAKHLRGDSMLDVIFNGSTARKPVSIASVELLFDNSLGRFGGQYASYADIRVKRQISRDGDAKYFLNGQKCRRKDVTELFMGTGLGARSYAIIGQGTISRLIESKPQDLRVFIEEAAGISRYKERRRDTEIRIRHTRENLERLGDIRLELTTQLEKLAEQAKTATQYRELKQQERDKDALLLVMRYRELDDAINVLVQQINKHDAELELLSTRHQSMKAEQALRSSHMESLTEQEHDAREVYYQLSTEIASLEQQIKDLQLRHSQATKQLQTIQHQIDLKQQTLQQVQQSEQAEHVKYNQTLEQISATELELRQAESEFSKAEAALSQLTDKKAAQDAQKLQLQHQLELANQQQQSQLRHVSQLQKNLEQHQEQLQQLDRLGATVDIEASQDEAEQLAQENEIVDEQLQELQDALATNSQKQANQQAKEQALLQSIASLKGRVAVLNELIAPHKETNQLWQHLEITPGWEKAAQLLLGNALRQPVNDTQELGFQLPERPTAALVTHTQAFKSSINLEPWVKSVHWVQNIQEAEHKLKYIAAHERIVSADGYLLGQGFRLAEVEEGQSAIVMHEECQKLTDELDLESERLKDCQQLLAQVNDIVLQQSSQITALKQKRAEQSNRQTQLKMKVELALKSQQNQQNQRLNLQQQCDAAKSELESLIEQQQQETDDKERKKLSLKAAVSQAIPTDAAFLQGQEVWRLATEKVTQCKLELGKQNQLQQVMKTKHLLLKQEEEQLLKRLDELSLEKSHQLKNGQMGEDQIDEDSLTERQIILTERLQKRSKQQQKLDELHQQQVALQQLFDQSSAAQNLHIENIQALAQNITELKLRREGLNGQLENQKQRLVEQDIDILTIDNKQHLGQDCQQVEKLLEKTRRAIARLGAINLAAIEEFELQSVRKNYLDEQDEDLSKALLSLEAAIKKIDKETRSRFKQTFDQVNEGLGQLFPKVFGGGSAYLALTESDLLDTGVTIMARPPGKKNSTIHLLSGGEKALTALSLVFAIFRLNPAPFCMLDEVDAPLDDANVERFCRLLKEMSQTVQFIYISHNKITMELADQLIGVTMQEPGVSRIVAVNIDEAMALADAV